MKYCSQCGHPLRENQNFCHQCGQRVRQPNYQLSNMSRAEQYHQKVVVKENKSKLPLILLGLCTFIVLILGLLFGVYQLLDKNGMYITKQKATTSSYETPTINVLSVQFSAQFMHQDRRNGYDGIRLGMSRNQIESNYGEPEETLHIAGVSAEKYGDIAVNYENDSVHRYFVVPENISVYQFMDYHGTPTMKADEGGIIYDDNSHNDFTIKVYVNEKGQVIGIENVNQIDRNDS
ncbi:zinc-ribbon domain-containing protein [Staphylococcus felis]|uniref:zinc-ribbon domain-containing protein n=1 Tax=Staphylococcus felis TaxID=46127 RepID=UPI0021D1C6DB|nr:zinc ribbon domain-containing protein [Staphylococcus felis]UXR86844.1 zinc ribbon domain-containing protein [Staphylococcus felis]